VGQGDKRRALFARELALEFLERIAPAADKKIRALDTWETGITWRALLSEERTPGKRALSGGGANSRSQEVTGSETRPASRAACSLVDVREQAGPVLTRYRRMRAKPRESATEEPQDPGENRAARNRWGPALVQLTIRESLVTLAQLAPEL
jgi:hypothetical protein